MPKTVFGGEHRHLVAVLVEARQASGLTQAELAARVGKDQSFVSIIERGQRRVDVLEFVALARAMNAEPTQLFEMVTRRLAKVLKI
ncbi:MAG TPA: XRE family transcriptional regulator [Pseudomonas sp.]|uniref:Predicted transcriptional regulator n=1 Tax=Brevundimonas vesicularis TaxID=41276 RepID=A0A2X1BDS8_BREVE|nr:helix-turn-helix transcriptional regulator [Brevundimonas vesicularis]SPU54550.1 Predicted transcriptional regulator [Brevundimonas vesicularis]HCJ28247.1 XRE family transcriptional regulator [Pseudomonas sp.]